MKITARILLISLTLVFLLTDCLAQKKTLLGEVRGKTGHIPGAAISLRRQLDSVLVKGTITSDSGRYSLEAIDTGRFLIQVSALGYQYYSNSIHLTEPSTTLNITLDTALNTLHTITIVGQKPFLTRAIDKTIVNIAGSIYSKGEDALRLFNVIPGVNVDPLNGIQFRGNQQVDVYVDGRKLYLSGQQLLAYLRSIPSEAIHSYELQAVPGAAFDAQHAGTIINITLKSDYKYGLSAQIGASYRNTRFNEYNQNAGLVYRAGRFTIQGNIARYQGKQFQEADEEQDYNLTGIKSEQRSRWTAKVRFHSAKFGADYRLSDRQTLGINYDYSVADFHSLNHSLSAFFSKPYAIPDSSARTENTGLNKWTNRLLNTFYRKKLDTTGGKLTVGYNYLGYHNAVSNDIRNTTAQARTERLKIDNPLNVDIQLINVDLEKKWDGIDFAAGAKYTYSQTDNSIVYHSDTKTIEDGWLVTNRFLYTENLGALYFSGGKNGEKWSAKLGLRAEHYRYRGISAITKEQNGKSQWALFPSLYLQRKLAQQSSVTLSASRRISRPDYRDLNPFVDISNPYFLEQGNPYLKPYFSYHTELQYLLRGKYSFTGGYQASIDVINNVYRQAGEVVITRPENSSDHQSVMLSLSIPAKIFDFWELSSSFTLRNTWVNLPADKRANRVKLSQDIWLQNKLVLPWQLKLEITAIYARNSFIGIYDLATQHRVDANLRKSFFKDKLTARLDIGDPFNLYKIKWRVAESTFSRTISRQLATRYFGIDLSYSFSSGKKSAAREDDNQAAEDARGRL
jgi:hypothetical protein